MKNSTSKGYWAIKNTAIPLDTPTADENAPEISAIERAADRLGAEIDGYDYTAGLIDAVSVTGPAEAIDALVALFCGDAGNPGQEDAYGITPLVIPTIDYFEAFNLINVLSENEGNDAAIIAIENWLGENAVAAAIKYAGDGRPDDAETIMDIYDGEDDDWADVVSAIDRARAREERSAEQDSANEEEPATAPIYPGYTEALVQAWRNDNENRNIEVALGANATDANNNPGNLYRAGVFAGLAEAAAWAIYNGSEVDDIEAIKEAVYRAYNVAW